MADASQNGELQEVIRNGRKPGIQSIAVCFYHCCHSDRVLLCVLQQCDEES